MTRARLRTAAAVIAMLLAIVAIARDDRRLTWIAIVAVALSLLLRFVTRPRAE